MKLVIAATPEVAIPTIEKLRNSTHQIKQIITQPDRPAGRGKVLTATPIGQNYQAAKPENEAEIKELLNDSDLLITIGYGRLLSEAILAIPKFGGINLHFSLLPKWRGAAPVQRALEAGDRVTGVTVFQMDKGMDTGPIWFQSEFSIPENYYADDLFAELARLGSAAILKTLELIETRSPSAQIGQPSIAAKISNEELEIDWYKPGIVIRNKIRGLGHGTYSTFRGEKVRISKVELSEVQLDSGEIQVEDKKLLVGTGDSALEIMQLTPAGKKQMTGFDFANGARLIAGEKFA